MVVFVSQRNGNDVHGYAEAAAAMDALAAQQPGYLGMVSLRDDAGFGITISYWADDQCAAAWRDNAAHAAVRQRGREDWYAGYSVAVARVERSYGSSR